MKNLLPVLFLLMLSCNPQTESNINERKVANQYFCDSISAIVTALSDTSQYSCISFAGVKSDTIYFVGRSKGDFENASFSFQGKTFLGLDSLIYASNSFAINRDNNMIDLWDFKTNPATNELSIDINYRFSSCISSTKLKCSNGKWQIVRSRFAIK